MNSNVLVKISKEISYAGQSMKMDEYATENYVYTEVGERQLFYSKAKGQLYAVNASGKTLKPVDMSQQAEQLSALRSQINNLNISMEEENGKKKYRINSDTGGMMSVEGEMHSSQNECLSQTAYADNHRWSQQAALVKVEIENNELVELLEITMKLNGNLVTNTTKVLHVEQLNEQVNRFDHVLAYSVV